MLLICVQAAGEVEGVVQVQGADQLEQLGLRPLLVPSGVVHKPHLPPHLQLSGQLVWDHCVAQGQPAGDPPGALGRQAPWAPPPDSSPPAVGQQGVIVGEPDSRRHLLHPGDRWVIVVKQYIQLLSPDDVQVKAALRQHGREVHKARAVGGLILYRQIKGSLFIGRRLQGGVESDGAGGDADGQQQQDADDRHGQVGGVDPAQPLAQGE